MALTTAQIKENIQALRQQGADSSVIDSYVNQVGFSSDFQSIMDEVEASKNTPLGKFLQTSGKAINFFPDLLGFSRENSYEDILRKRYMRDLKGESQVAGAVKDIAKQGVVDAFALAQIQTGGVGAPVKAGAKQLLKYGAKQALIQGGLGTAKRKAEGQTTGEALKGGAVEGALNAATIIGIPAFAKIVKESGKALLKGSSKVRNFAIDYAFQKPEVLEGVKKTVVEVGDEIVNSLGQFADNVKMRYRKRWDELAIPEGLNIDVSPIRDFITELGVDRRKLASKLKSEIAKQVSPVTENAIDRFVNGGNLSAEEAKQINSFLFDIVDTGAGEALGSGAIGRISQVKKEFLNLLDDQIPGLRDLNKFYAESLDFYKKTFSDVAKKTGDLNEASLNIIGQRQAGLGTAGRAKSQQLSRLQKLDKLMGTNHVESLTDSLVAQEFEKIGMSNLMTNIRIGTTGGIGAFIGAQAGGAPGAVAGSILGTGLSELAGSPQMTKKIIKRSKTFGVAGRKLFKPRKATGMLRAGLLSEKQEEQ